MQPGKLAASVLHLLVALLLSVLAPFQYAHAQAALETPQEVNDRIRSLSARARLIPRDYVIGNGDVISLEVFDVKELSREVRVSQTGTIGIPLVPVRLHLSGLTEIQAEQKIAEVLEANGLVSHPEVSVTVKERKSKPITVVGAVPHPMVMQADRPITLLELLAEAGGVSNDAGDTLIVILQSRPPSANLPCQTPRPAITSLLLSPRNHRTKHPLLPSHLSSRTQSLSTSTTSWKPAIPQIISSSRRVMWSLCLMPASFTFLEP
jgi:hypothetical protein